MLTKSNFLISLLYEYLKSENAIIKVKNSEAGITKKTPSVPKNLANNGVKVTMNKNVLQKAIIAEVIPSLSAVNKLDR